MTQPNLFETDVKNTDAEKILLYALGEFQSRGKVLAERELALDRLRGAFRRAAEKFAAAELSDEQIAANLEKLGARVKKLELFIAKHPFRVIVSEELAERSRLVYKDSLNND